MTVGENLSGFAFVINTGREPATIVKTTCMTYWHQGHLPMYRPYNAFEPKEGIFPPQAGDCIIDILEHLGTGKAARWSFDTTVPPSYTPSTFLYLLGNVEFKDRLGTRHIVLFARKYDPGLGRFVAVENNPDYESVE
ncbi:hypothetical protein BH10PSE11_BH10PSE11_06040 [soil metagenome]